jgi:hypothetical protein
VGALIAYVASQSPKLTLGSTGSLGAISFAISLMLMAV